MVECPIKPGMLQKASQVKRIDYQETFDPTASPTSVRVLIQTAAQNDLLIHQMDVKTAGLERKPVRSSGTSRF